MRISGIDLNVPRTGMIRLAGTELRVTAPPLAFEDELDQALPMPSPPLRAALDRRGRPVRDENREVIGLPDRTPAHVKEESRVVLLRFVALLQAATSATGAIEWDAQRAAFDTPRKFYEALLAELLKTAITSGELMAAVADIRRLGQLTDVEVAQARSDFSLTEGAEDEG